MSGHHGIHPGLSCVAWIYTLSQDRLTSAERLVSFATPIPQDTAAVGRGKHLGLTRGCGGARGRFVHLTDGEVRDLLVFLKERLRP